MIPSARSNPFADAPTFATDPFAATDDRADPGTFTYALVKSGPDVDPDEAELAGVAAVEVLVAWGATVLHVEHLVPPRAFHVGEEQGRGVSCDYLVPADKLGTTRAPVVLVRDGEARAVIQPGAKGTVEMPGAPPVSVAEAIGRGLAVPCPERTGAWEVPLPAGARVRTEVGDIAFVVASVAAGRPVGLAPFASSTSAFGYTGLTLLAHVGILAALAFFRPGLGVEPEEGGDRDRVWTIQQYLGASAEREREAREEQAEEDRARDREGGQGSRAPDEGGAAGTPESAARNRRLAVKGPPDTTDPRIARDEARRDAETGFLIGLLASGMALPSAHHAPWGADATIGREAFDARGNLWGATLGDATGGGGWELSGTGEGGGCLPGLPCGWVGLGSIGTWGRGSGTGNLDGFGPGDGSGLSHGRAVRAHVPKGPSVRVGQTSVGGGRLPPEVIQRIVRQNYGRFRLCYESGLRQNPTLQGRVAVRFVIGRDGAVGSVSAGGSDLPDAAVVQCVSRAFYGLSFPEPEGGIVTVTYPILFTPGE